MESAIRDFDSELRLMLVHTAVILANERPLLAEPRLNALYGGLIPPPEGLRRAATINVLAQLAGLSRETTRRFVGQLEARGFVGRAAGGVLARMEGEHLAFCIRRVLDLYPNIRQFVAILRAGGAVFQEAEARSVA